MTAAVRWSAEDTARITELRAAGLTFKAIAAEVGMSKNAVAAKLGRMGLAGPSKAREARVAADAPFEDPGPALPFPDAAP